MKDTLYFHVFGGIVLLVFVLGYLFPDTWWTTHFLAFTTDRYVFLTLTLAFVVFFGVPFLLKNKKSSHVSTISIALIAVVFAFFSSQFKMAKDNYGEAYILNSQIDVVPSSIPQKAQEAVFSYGVNAWDGQKTIFGLITYIAYYQSITYREVFHQVNVVMAFLFAFLLQFTLRKVIPDRKLNLLLVIGALTSPFIFNFFGHTEINSIVLVWIQLTLFTIVSIVKSTKKKVIIWVWVVLFFAFKFHAIHLLFVPIAIWLTIFKLKIDSQILNFKVLIYYVLLPVFLAGAFLYFFYFEDYKDLRHLQFNAQEYDRLFLPLVSPEAPLNRYNLLSFNHVFDYALMLFVWFPMGVLSLLAVVKYRKRIQMGSHILTVVIGMFIVFFSFFFVLNPLLSMQMDWDLFCLPAPVFILLSALIYQNLNLKLPELKVIARYFSVLSVLSLAVITVHNNEDALSKRLEVVGKRIYHTYYEWATQTIEFSYTMGADSKDVYAIAERRGAVIDELRQYAIKGKDIEFARLLKNQGTFMARVKNDLPEALALLHEAELYSLEENNVTLMLMETYFRLKDFSKAEEYANKLVENKFPTEQKSLRIAIHVALEAENYSKAERYASDYLLLKNDPLIHEVFIRLQKQNKIQELKFLFSK